MHSAFRSTLRRCAVACCCLFAPLSLHAAPYPGSGTGAPHYAGESLLSVRSIATNTHPISRIDHPDNGPGSDGASGDSFGRSVALQGDWAFVGVSRDERRIAGRTEGAVYVFSRQAGNWGLHQKLIAPASSNAQCFGWAVAATADTLAATSGPCINAGEGVHVFALEQGMWSLRQWLPAPQANLNFGQSVDIEADTLVVGANGNGGTQPGGAVHVFVRSAGSFAPQQVLTASDATNNDQLGFSVALAGDRILAGAPFNTLGGFSEGSAFTFERVGATWTQRQAIYPADPEAFANFGFSVALTAQLAVIGSPGDSVNSSNNPGSAYVYAHNGSTFGFEHKLRSNDGENSDDLGRSLAISGSTVIVGSPGKVFAGNANQGAAYAFQRVSGQWLQQARFTASDGDAEDAFGFSLALDGDEALVGANIRTINSNLSQGVVYGFARTGEQWAQGQQLSSGDGAAFANFGQAVAVAGEFAVVGVPGDGIGNNQRQGAAYVFRRLKDSWQLLQRISAADGSQGDGFGVAVAMDAATIVIGADFADAGPLSDTGAAYVFELDGASWVQRQKLVSPTASSAAYFGKSLALSGATIVVGSVHENVDSANQRGAAHVFQRDGSAWTYDERILAPDGSAFDRFGHSVDLMQGTLVVSARRDDNGQLARGSVFVFERSGDTWPLQQKLTIAMQFEEFGSDVALSRDRLAVGANFIAGGGAVYVFERAGSTWTGTQRLPSDAQGFGENDYAAVVAIDGDRLAASTPELDGMTGNVVRQVSVYQRAAGTWTRVARLRPDDARPDSQFGNALALAADETVVGAPGMPGLDEFANPASGAVYEFRDAIFRDGFESLP